MHENTFQNMLPATDIAAETVLNDLKKITGSDDWELSNDGTQCEMKFDTALQAQAFFAALEPNFYAQNGGENKPHFSYKEGSASITINVDERSPTGNVSALQAQVARMSEKFGVDKIANSIKGIFAAPEQYASAMQMKRENLQAQEDDLGQFSRESIVYRREVRHIRDEGGEFARSGAGAGYRTGFGDDHVEMQKLLDMLLKQQDEQQRARDNTQQGEGVGESPATSKEATPKTPPKGWSDMVDSEYIDFEEVTQEPEAEPDLKTRESEATQNPISIEVLASAAAAVNTRMPNIASGIEDIEFEPVDEAQPSVEQPQKGSQASYAEAMNAMANIRSMVQQNSAPEIGGDIALPVTLALPAAGQDPVTGKQSMMR